MFLIRIRGNKKSYMGQRPIVSHSRPVACITYLRSTLPQRLKMIKLKFCVNHFPLDVNECSVRNGDCDHICKNKQGSFECRCKVGYKLHSDKKTCSGKSYFDIDRTLKRTGLYFDRAKYSRKAIMLFSNFWRFKNHFCFPERNRMH